MTHRIPSELKTVARLGAIADYNHTLIVVGTPTARALFLAEYKEACPCACQRYPHRSWVECMSRMTPLLPWMMFATHHDVILTVVDHLGTIPESKRSDAIIEADHLGIPILVWPGDRLPYRVEFPPNLAVHIPHDHGMIMSR